MGSEKFALSFGGLAFMAQCRPVSPGRDQVKLAKSGAIPAPSPVVSINKVAGDNGNIPSDGSGSKL
jgi:hypothetical protein